MFDADATPVKFSLSLQPNDSNHVNLITVKEGENVKNKPPFSKIERIDSEPIRLQEFSSYD
jgi:hypothetical protein